MPRSQTNLLETILDEATQSLNIKALNVFLQKDFEERAIIQCSQHFLNKLDTFICKSLDESDIASACLGFTVIYTCGKHLKLPGGKGLSSLITLGLVTKMLQWFEMCRQLWVLGGSLKDENLLNLAEDFFDALREVHESGNTGVIQVTESFLYPIGHMAVDTRIYILIQKEAIRKFNLILDKSPRELKKHRKILQSQDAADIVSKIVSRILDGGDYDFQTALMEALCRMVTSGQRRQLADRWFPIERMSTAFARIKDSEFETDCRKFLNIVNEMKGDRTSVISYPCFEVYLGKTELLKPADEKLEEFWIDFNIGSQSISFYFSLHGDAQEGQWETICINEHEVQSYTVKGHGKRSVLQLDLSEVLVVDSLEGSTLTIHFSCGLDILSVVQDLYGHNKHTGFVGKTGTSVVKTTVKVGLDENSTTSQIVPESQLSLEESDKNVASIQIKTPAKMRLSESTTYISSSGGGGARSVSAVLPAAKCKGRPPLEMARSVERSGQNDFGFNTAPITVRRDAATEQTSTLKTTETDKNKKSAPLSKARAMVLPGPSEDELPLDSTFVPDSQPTTGRNISSNWPKYSVSEMLLMQTQKMCSLPISGSPPSLSQKQVGPSAQKASAPSSVPIHPKQLHAELTQRLQEVLMEKNQAPSPQIVSMQKRQNSNADTDPKPKSLVAPIDHKEMKKPQRNSKVNAKNKIKSQMEEDAVVVKAPVKAAEENVSLTVKSTAMSSKEKRNAEVTGKMVKHISSHYEVNSLIKVKGNKISQSLIAPLIDRPFFNMKWHTSMGNVTTLLKSNSKTEASSTRERKDVFAFNVDTPQSIKLNKSITSSSRISATDEDSRLPSTEKKEQPPPKGKRCVKKHLFSDTDTDRGATDVSWVRESSRKPKPQVVKYSRQVPAKPKVAPTLPSCDSPDLPAPSPVLSKASTKSTKDVSQPQQRKVKAAQSLNKAPVASRRPPRAAAKKHKNYKERDSDESQSESELSKGEKSGKTQEIREKTKKNKPSKSYIEPESNNSQSESEVDQPKCYVDELKKQGKKSTTRTEQAANKKQKNTSLTDLQKSCEKQLKPVNGSEKSAEKPKKPSKKNAAPVKEQTATLKPPRAERQAAVSPPPSFIERMRSAERFGPSLDVPCSPVLSLRGSPLTLSPPYVPGALTPILQLPKLCSTNTSAGDLKVPSFYSAEKKTGASRTQSIKSVTSLPSLTARGFSKPCAAVRASAIQSPEHEDLTSPAQSPLSLSQPLMTSTLVNQDKPAVASVPQSPLSEVHSSRSSHLSFTKMSETSLYRVSSKSSVTGKVKDKDDDALSFGLRAEKTPKMNESLESVEDVVSGPSRKRHISYSSSNSDEEEKEQIKKCKMRTQHSPQMKPRKLFKSASKAQDSTEGWRDQNKVDKTRGESRTEVPKKLMEENVSAKKKRSKTDMSEDTVTEVSAEGGVSQLLSSSHTVISGQWDADVEDADMEEDMDGSMLNPQDVCRKFSCKLQQKFKSRFKMVEVYNKQSLKSVQQHISTINSDVAKHRVHGLEQVQRVLLEEVHKLEQDDTVLKNMENDLTMHWNKQTVAFRSLQKQEKRRNEVLRTTLVNNLCHSLEYEERVFTSQMCLVRKDMKSAQDRLLNEMHEGEVQSVKRGLHALFFPDATRF